MDVIVRYLAGGGTARVVVVVATELVREAARRHDATVGAAVAMGRAATAGLLLATLTKGDERVTLQILGDGPLGALTVDAKADGTARVFVKNPPVALFPANSSRPSLGPIVGRVGVVSVVRDLGLGHDFRGQTSIVDGEIDTDVERYLSDSEQIDSALGCETIADDAGGIQIAFGILVQALPGSDGSTLVAAARGRLRAGACVELLTGPFQKDMGRRTGTDTDRRTRAPPRSRDWPSARTPRRWKSWTCVRFASTAPAPAIERRPRWPSSANRSWSR